MEKSLLEQVEIWINMISKIAIPVILVILGSWLNTSYKEKELRQKYIEIAVGILSNKATPETLPLRNWAINTINHYAEVKLPSEVKGLLKEKPLPKHKTFDDIKDFESIKDVDSVK